MHIADRIFAIERRAETLNLSLWRLSKIANVDYSNISRWRRGECSPTIGRFETVMGALEAQVTELERKMADDLQRGLNRDRCAVESMSGS
jgi:hypothetical protein